MLIDRIFKKVKTYLNTDGRGNFSPEDFNLMLHDAIQSRVEEYFPDITRSTNRQNRGLMANHLENAGERTREKMLHFLKTETLGLSSPTTRTLPSDLRYTDEIEMSDGTSLEVCENRKEFNILKSQATLQYPVCYQTENEVRISPENSGLMSITYLRTIKYPKWTYVEDVNGNEFFNASAVDFEDADIHPSEEDEMVRRVLMRFGVNLKEQDIAAFVVNEERQDFQENNQS